MLDETEVLRTFATLRRETLHVWIERGWLSPARTARGYSYLPPKILVRRVAGWIHGIEEAGCFTF